MPDIPTLGESLLELAERFHARFLLIDGPQAWKAPNSRLEHQRVCEWETRTPGKTGLPGCVKPQPWTRMAEFSVGLFDFLHEQGWHRYSGDQTSTAVAVETFPTHAWRCLGKRPLPAKSKRDTCLADWASWLASRFNFQWPREPTHDEIQAVVAGLAGLALGGSTPWGFSALGLPPTLEKGHWREGFIVSPTHEDDPSEDRC